MGSFTEFETYQLDILSGQQAPGIFLCLPPISVDKDIPLCPLFYESCMDLNSDPYAGIASTLSKETHSYPSLKYFN